MPEEKWDVVMTDQGLVQAPDLIVEVLSPGNRETEINHKTQAYLGSGVQEVIIVSLHWKHRICPPGWGPSHVQLQPLAHPSRSALSLGGISPEKGQHFP